MNPTSNYDTIPLDTAKQVGKYICDENGMFKAEVVAKWPRVPAASLGIDRKNQLITFPMEYYEKRYLKSIDWRGRLCLVYATGTNKNKIPLDLYTFGPEMEMRCYSFYFYPGENKKELSTEWGEWLSTHVGIDNLHKMPQCPEMFSIDDTNVSPRDYWLNLYLADNSSCKGFDKNGRRYIAIKIQHFDHQGSECYQSIEVIHEKTQKTDSYTPIPVSSGSVKVTRSIFATIADFNALASLLGGEKFKSSQMRSGYVQIC